MWYTEKRWKNDTEAERWVYQIAANKNEIAQKKDMYDAKEKKN